MGGTALGFEAKRMNLEEYHRLSSAALKQVGNHIRKMLIPSYLEKESFGDIDIIVAMTPKEWEQTVSALKKRCPIHHHNKDFFSYGLKDGDDIVQVDLIYVGSDYESLMCAYGYYAYNDRGNLVGKIARRCGFKYGANGLTYAVYDPKNPTNCIGQICLSKTTHEIFRFLGYSHLLYVPETLEDMFEWVASSPYFDRSIYQLDSLTSQQKVRDKKRTTYQKFLQWCEQNPQYDNGYTEEQVVALRQHKLHEALTTFDRVNEYNEIFEEHHRNEYLKTVYNGCIVSKLTGISDRELGRFMQHMKKKYDTQSFVDNMSPMQIKKLVIEEFEEYKKER